MKNFLLCDYCGAKNHKDHLACHCCGAPVGIVEEETSIIVNPITYPKSEPYDIVANPEWIYRPYPPTTEGDYWNYLPRTVCIGSGDSTNLTIGGSHSPAISGTAIYNSVPCTLTF